MSTDIPRSDNQTVLPLPDDQHALIRAPRQVPEKLRRPLTALTVRMSALMPEGVDTMGEDAQALAMGRAMSADPGVMDAMNDALILALVAAWSYEHPVSAEGLGELPGCAYDAIKAHCETLRSALMPSFKPTPEGDSPFGH